MATPWPVRDERGVPAPTCRARSEGTSGDAAAVEVVVASLAVARGSLGAAEELLSSDERRRADRFAFERDRGRFVMARARLRELLGARLGARPESVELEYGLRGKPALAPGFRESGLRFNLSRCGNLAVYAFSYRHEVGIDAEGVRAVRDAQQIVARFFSEREHAAYCALPAAERPLGFFNCWTRKEAFVKAIGDGLGHPLDAFEVTLAPGEPARIVRVGRLAGERCGWRLHSFVPAAGVVAALVTEMPVTA
jgi:4'-phosphopantetheinyl transferase